MTTHPSTPRDVTLIHRINSGSASVVRITKVGRTYWHGCGLWQRETDEGGGLTEGYATRWAKADYLLVEGAQWDVVKAVRACHIDYQNTVRRHAAERDDAKREMLRVWEDHWDREHPTPRRNSSEEIVARWQQADMTTPHEGEAP